MIVPEILLKFKNIEYCRDFKHSRDSRKFQTFWEILIILKSEKTYKHSKLRTHWHNFLRLFHLCLSILLWKWRKNIGILSQIEQILTKYNRFHFDLWKYKRHSEKIPKNFKFCFDLSPANEKRLSVLRDVIKNKQNQNRISK